MPNGINASFLTIFPSASKCRSGRKFVGSFHIAGSLKTESKLTVTILFWKSQYVLRRCLRYKFIISYFRNSKSLNLCIPNGTMKYERDRSTESQNFHQESFGIR